MTHLHPLFVEQSLTLKTVLRPVLIGPEDQGWAQFPSVSAETGLLSVEGTPAVVVAQLEDIDILRDMGNLWNTFIDSGQVWALIIGLVIGYFLRGLTTYS